MQASSPITLNDPVDPPVMEHRAGIIASKRCNNVEIYDNEVYDGGDEAVGIFLHRSTDDAVVYSENN